MVERRIQAQRKIIDALCVTNDLDERERLRAKLRALGRLHIRALL